jgi:O-acetyl-ADP-ribose deacetylase (regulator of RNase III)
MDRIVLCDTNKAVVSAWLKVFVDHRDIEIVEGSIIDQKVDAVVSPANSFGFMDGGADAVYLEKFGPIIQENVQVAIRDLFDGELLVGQAVAAETGQPGIAILIAAPTMRVPKQIHDPADVFLATRAALRLALKLPIRSIAFPGMGTGTGLIHPVPAAWCMRAAIEDARTPLEFPASTHEAAHRHFKLPLPRFGGT